MLLNGTISILKKKKKQDEAKDVEENEEGCQKEQRAFRQKSKSEEEMK
jgi:hypothetical protein